MKEAKIIEMVLWNAKAGVSVEDAKRSITQLNDFVKIQPGFISRKTSQAADGQFLDLVLWTDLNSAKTAAKKAMENESLIEVFSKIDQEDMLFKHFEIFNQME